MKAVIVVVLMAIVAVLASAGVAMLKRPSADKPRDESRMARALALRVLLSIALFLFILLAWQLGWIQPTGLPVSR
ncbi:MAG TPA: DUF2909 domain-containing protein [Burkholderiaceae bacterium]|nr:DUF2909 domain-containing protein [Burkholderiaceae bacterium]